ncbi:hypothetical protein JCM6882_001849 [Rhodosporidiobolus microsporus]
MGGELDGRDHLVYGVRIYAASLFFAAKVAANLTGSFKAVGLIRYCKSAGTLDAGGGAVERLPAEVWDLVHREMKELADRWARYPSEFSDADYERYYVESDSDPYPPEGRNPLTEVILVPSSTPISTRPPGFAETECLQGDFREGSSSALDVDEVVKLWKTSTGRFQQLFQDWPLTPGEYTRKGRPGLIVYIRAQGYV